MKKKILLLVIMTFLLTGCVQEDNISTKFDGLTPKAIYKEYRIYDIVEQRGLACAEALEILDSDDTYDYYFNCLKSEQIYLVSNDEIIKVKNAYQAGIITLEELYNLKIVGRTLKISY